jgi:hypothetical protein
VTSGNDTEQEAGVPRLILAGAAYVDNTPHGYNWTFAFPMVLFVVVALVLYGLFSRPHRRVPWRQIASDHSLAQTPGPEAARSAGVAGGLSLAEGGGTAESEHEPAGAHVAAVTADDAGTHAESAADPAGPAEPGDPGDDTEAGE